MTSSVRRAPAGLAALAVAASLALAACGSGAAGPDVGNNTTTSTIGSSTTTTAPNGTSTTTESPPTTAPQQPATTTTSPGSATQPSGGAVPSGFQPGSVTFVSSAEGFVLGRNPSCTGGDCAALVRTTNTGSSWVGLNTPAVPYVTPFISSSTTSRTGVSEVRFASPLIGWIFGPALYVTRDGGSSWQSVNIGGSVISLETAGGVVDALVAPCTPSTKCRGAVRLEQASVNGESFKTVATGPVESLSTGASPDLSLQPPAGFAILGESTTGADVYATDDLANPSAWKKFPDPCARSQHALSSFVAPDSSTLYSLCTGNGAAGSTSKVAVATNGGTSTDVGKPPAAGDGGAVAGTPYAVMVIATASAGSWLYRSGDGGHSWSTVKSYSDAGAGWNDVGFTTARQGVVIHGRPGEANVPGGIGLLMTRDAGITWQPVPIG